MRSVYEAQRFEQIEIEGHVVNGRATCVPRWKFADVCRVLWPLNTAANLAAIGKRDERTAKRWLSGEYEPPASVLAAIINKMFER